VVGYGRNPAGQTEPWIARLDPCVASPGAVPDGAAVAGLPLTVEKSAGPEIVLRWSPACSPAANDYEVYEGTLDDFTSHAPRHCSTSGVLSAAVIPDFERAYYLVVPRDAAVEGSYGKPSAAPERPPSTSACRPQVLDRCP
jgi:hypothetical protein